jgi:hypothetical protein
VRALIGGTGLPNLVRHRPPVIDYVTARYSASATYGVKIVLGIAGTYTAAINQRYPGALAIKGGGAGYIITGGECRRRWR